MKTRASPKRLIGKNTREPCPSGHGPKRNFHTTGPVPGATLPNLPLGDGHLLDHFGLEPVALIRAEDTIGEQWLQDHAQGSEIKPVIITDRDGAISTRKISPLRSIVRWEKAI